MIRAPKHPESENRFTGTVYNWNFEEQKLEQEKTSMWEEVTIDRSQISEGIEKVACQATTKTENEKVWCKLFKNLEDMDGDVKNSLDRVIAEARNRHVCHYFFKYFNQLCARKEVNFHVRLVEWRALHLHKELTLGGRSTNLTSS